ncbi:18037_t:CDS:1, partial [Cetraspora pellucida]
AVKYLYKYVYKGHDKTVIEVNSDISLQKNQNVNEISQYIEAQWISSSEACWRIFGFSMFDMNPSIVRLQLHLLDQQIVNFNEKNKLVEVLMNENNKKTTLTEYFHLNSIDSEAHNYLYAEILTHYVWNIQSKKWTKRKKGNAIGRIYTAYLSENERYYLRLLLNHVRGATSYDDLKHVNGYQCNTFKESAQCRDLLESDKSLHECMSEARQFYIPCALRNLFSIILVFGESEDPKKLWDENFQAMSEDFTMNGIPEGQLRVNAVLKHINQFLQQHNKSIDDYGLPKIDSNYADDQQTLLREELSISIKPENLTKIQTLNETQKNIFNMVIDY